ncbi:MAG: MFS transporter, partial [Chloroflexi bacterium]|nr:MFS transporter [Chloroflexota bacterium]
MTLGRSYRRLWTATAASNLADGVFQVALPLTAVGITRSPAQVAGVTIAARLPWLTFALYAGALADRLDRRRTMIAVDVGRVVLIGMLAAVVALQAEQLWVLYVVALALGIGETIFDTAAQSVMPMVVGRDQLSSANSRLFAAEIAMNRFVGPPIGGLLAGAALA